MARVPFRSEEELLAKLDKWLAARDVPPTIDDIIQTADVELMAAYVLNAARTGARDTAVNRLDHLPNGRLVHSRAGSSVMRIFAGLARAWSLSHKEEMGLLGIGSPAELEKLTQVPKEEVPIAVVERLAILLDIFQAINTLLPVPERADEWLRKANSGPTFGGRPPLALMTEGLSGLRLVRRYVQSEAWPR